MMMDFAVKSIVLLLLVVDVFGRSVLPKDSNVSPTELNRTISSPEDGSCELNGILYPLNSLFNVPMNPCFVCECNENWTGVISNTSCYKEECDEVLDKPQEGCIPVYDETKCCIIDFYCRENIIPGSTEDSETESDNATAGNDEVVCPTPICADESCRIEVPPGQFCPSCICEGLKEKNEFESSEDLVERTPLEESQNASEDVEFFLIPVPWSGIADGVENSFEGGSNEDGSKRFEYTNSVSLEQDNENGILRQESSSNIFLRDIGSRRTEPRRKRSSFFKDEQQQQQQQQQWSVFQDDASESEERVRNYQDSGEDLKIFSQEGSENKDALEEVCPTPMCDTGCHIYTPPGGCPTCVCGPR